MRSDRHPAESFGDILARDTRAVPEFLREHPSFSEPGVEPIAASRYFSREFHELEVERIWSRVWQMVCREEQIPDVGDYQIYDLAGRSLIVVRGLDRDIRAFHNSCLHRGRKLVTAPGCRKTLRCSFHGIAWNCSGELQENPIAWDFPQWENKDMSLPRANVATWGGFVFINMDADAPTLESIVGPMRAHFERYELENRYLAVHVAKVIRANWKVAAEAFMESHHTVATHPQLLPYLADVNSQYDLLSDYVSRQFTAAGVPSPVVAHRHFTATDIVNAMAADAGYAKVHVPAGISARAYAAELTRERLSAEDGWDYSAASDSEMIDPLLYNVWPNMSFWAGFAPNLVYRWRPHGADPDRSIMDVMILKRIPKGSARPRPGVVKMLDENAPWSDASELGGLARVFEQDMENLPYVQEGLRASASGLVHFSRYTELRLRQQHRMLDRYIAKYKSSS